MGILVHKHYGRQSLSFILCSSILNSTLVVNEDQATDRDGVAQPTCTVNHEEYD